MPKLQGAARAVAILADWPPGGGSLFSFDLPAVGSRATDPNVRTARRAGAKRAPAVERRAGSPADADP